MPFQTALAAILNAPWELLSSDTAGQEPIVAPPIYGCWHAAVHHVTVPPAPLTAASWAAPRWLHELNLDPRHRVVAAMGTQVVQAHQEQLMASAWEQLGDIEAINQRRRQAQLSRAVNARYLEKTFSRLSEEAFVRVVALAQSRVALTEQLPSQPPTEMLLAQKLAGSFVPPTVISAPLRKFARPRGAINRQYAQAGTRGAGSMFHLFSTTTIDQVTEKLSSLIDFQRGFIWVPEAPAHWERLRVETRPMVETYRLPIWCLKKSFREPIPGDRLSLSRSSPRLQKRTMNIWPPSSRLS